MNANAQIKSAGNELAYRSTFKTYSVNIKRRAYNISKPPKHELHINKVLEKWIYWRGLAPGGSLSLILETLAVEDMVDPLGVGGVEHIGGVADLGAAAMRNAAGSFG